MTRLLIGGEAKVVAYEREAGMRRKRRRIKRAWHHGWLWIQKQIEGEKGQLV